MTLIGFQSLTRQSFAAAAILAAASAAGIAQTAPTTSADTPAVATTKETSALGQSTEGTCVNAASQAEPATAPVNDADGTVEGNSGWTGGTGGSMIGTNPQGATSRSKTWHSPTARGLDLKGVPEPTTASATGTSAAGTTEGC